MPPELVFIHTSPVHIATFDRLVAESGAAIPVRHVVAENLLESARRDGLTKALGEQVEDVVRHAANNAAVVVCTCSSIGALAEAAEQAAGCPVVRVDRAMAEQAVRTGGRILVAAALASTRAPTEALLHEVAAQQQVEIELIPVDCSAAWQHFEQGDHAAYSAAIAEQLRAAAPGDVIVLAQASMAGAAQACADLGIPILSSPQPGLNAALACYRQAVQSATNLKH